MESIARALEVESRICSNSLTFQAGGVKVEEIQKLLEVAAEEKKRTIIKIVRAVLRRKFLDGRLVVR